MKYLKFSLVVNIFVWAFHQTVDGQTLSSQLAVNLGGLLSENVPKLVGNHISYPSKQPFQGKKKFAGISSVLCSSKNSSKETKARKRQTSKKAHKLHLILELMDSHNENLPVLFRRQYGGYGRQ